MVPPSNDVSPGLDVLESVTHDPPPPYPSPGRSRRTRANRNRIQINNGLPSSDSQSHSDDCDPPVFPGSEEPESPTETTPFLSPATRRFTTGRPRSASHTSTIFSSTSVAPSLTHTVFSMFQTDGDDDDGEDENGNPDRELRLVENEETSIRSPSGGFFSRHAWRRYFGPVVRKAYYKSLLHLLLLNFPYALVTWVYLFVFTLTGTTLLIALPLGAILCFFNLLGARAFARGELALQTYFHSIPYPYPPRPIFTRLREREATTLEIEAGAIGSVYVPERSFYKNTYAMFTDPTSYQSLFYFLVIKPSITLLLTLILLVLVPVSVALVLPAPAMLRGVRRAGVWQARIAVEGLWVAVR